MKGSFFPHKYCINPDLFKSFKSDLGSGVTGASNFSSFGSAALGNLILLSFGLGETTTSKSMNVRSDVIEASGFKHFVRCNLDLLKLWYWMKAGLQWPMVAGFGSRAMEA